MISAKLARMSARERGGLLLAACVVGLLLLDWVVVRPVVRTSGRLAEQIRGVEREIAGYRAVAAERPQREPEFNQASGVLRTAASRSEEIAAIKGQVDELARNAGLTVSSMEHEEPRARPHYDEYIVRIGKFESSGQALLEFLDQVQRTEDMLRVARLSLAPGSAADGGSASGRVKGSMLITKVMLSGGGASNAVAAAAPPSVERAAAP
jgi:type II secretory pathway component PulM